VSSELRVDMRVDGSEEKEAAVHGSIEDAPSVGNCCNEAKRR